MQGFQKNHKSNKAQQPPEFLAVGRILRPHGVRGNLLIKAESELIKSISPGSEIFVGSAHSPFTVKYMSPHRDQYILSLEMLYSRDDAEAYRESFIYVRFENTASLPENVFFYWQLLGLEVHSDEDENLGSLQDIIETGANDVYVVRSEKGDELLLPAIESVIKSINLDENLMIVHLIPGLRPDTK
jgi:16S rRNA processing protein RimM